MTATYPAFQVDFAPGVASSDVPAGGDWVDITSKVVELDVRIGRQDEFTQPSAGSATLKLDNSAGLFDPDNTGGTYYGDLLPLVWFRIQGGTTTANTGVFYGQVTIEGWRLEASQFASSVVTVDLLDMFEQLANTELPGSVFASVVAGLSPVLWFRLGESSGTVAVDSSATANHGVYEGGATFNSRAGLVAGDSDNAIAFDGVDDRVVIPASFDWTSESTSQVVVFTPGTIGTDRTIIDFRRETTIGVFRVSRLRLLASGALQWSTPIGRYTTTETLSAGTTYVVSLRYGAVLPPPLRINGVAGTLAGPSGLAGADAGATGQVQLIGANIDGGEWSTDTIDEVVFFDSVLADADNEAIEAAVTAPWEGELTSDRATHILDAADFPVGLRTIDTGQSTMPAASLASDVLSALLDVNKAERGELYIDHHDAGKLRFRDRHARWTDSRSLTSQATFGDSGSEVTYTNIDVQDDRIINSASVQRSGGATITATDAASITTYQTRSYAETGLLLEDDAEVESRANLIVAEHKDRHRRVRSITLEPAKSTHSAWAQVFARQIGDRITVKWRPPYGGTYSWDSWIIGRSLSWRPGDRKPLRVVFFLQPVPYGATAEPYFIVGTSTVSGPAVVGY